MQSGGVFLSKERVAYVSSDCQAADMAALRDGLAINAVLMTPRKIAGFVK